MKNTKDLELQIEELKKENAKLKKDYAFAVEIGKQRLDLLKKIESMLKIFA